MTQSVHFPPPAGEGLRPKEWGRWHDGDGGRTAEDEGACHEECESWSFTFISPLKFPLHAASQSPLLPPLCFDWSAAHVFLCQKVDANKDRLVTLEEFLKSTEKKEFNNAKEWEVKSTRGGLEGWGKWTGDWRVSGSNPRISWENVGGEVWCPFPHQLAHFELLPLVTAVNRSNAMMRSVKRALCWLASHPYKDLM